MDVEPHPDLKVEFPNRMIGSAPYLLDASYYEGKYYLYFGPVPALLLLLPYHLITGYDLPEPIAATFFVTLGLTLSVLWLYVLATRVLRLDPAPLAFGLCILALGLVNVAPATLVRPLFYEIAVGAGYAFTQASLLAVTLAFIRSGQSLRWLAIASLFAGFAAGSRPNLIVGAAFLLPLSVAGIWLRSERSPRTLILLLGAAGLPVALMVGGLLGYNYARFDRWFEFGNNLQLGANPHGFGFTLANFWHNLQLYYLTVPSIDWYFPFFAPGTEPPRPEGYFGVEEAHGQLVLIPAIILALVIGAARRTGLFRADTGMWIIAITLVATLVNFALVASSGVRTNRYMMDFQPGLVVMIALATNAALSDPRRWLRFAGGLSAVLLLCASAYNVLISFHAGQRFLLLDPAGYSAIERRINSLVAPLFARVGPAPGEQQWTVKFPENVTNRLEPLLVAGSISGHDALYIEFLDLGRARLHFEHSPHGLIPGPAFSYEPGQVANMTLRLGTLFPPLHHAWYQTLPVTAQQHLRREISVFLGDQAILLAHAATYPSTLANATVGAKGIGLRGESFFSGTIISERSPGPPAEEPAKADSGDYLVTLPAGMIGHAEPLLAYGSEVVRMGGSCGS